MNREERIHIQRIEMILEKIGARVYRPSRWTKIMEDINEEVVKLNPDEPTPEGAPPVEDKPKGSGKPAEDKPKGDGKPAAQSK